MYKAENVGLSGSDIEQTRTATERTELLQFLYYSANYYVRERRHLTGLLASAIALLFSISFVLNESFSNQLSFGKVVAILVTTLVLSEVVLIFNVYNEIQKRILKRTERGAWRAILRFVFYFILTPLVFYVLYTVIIIYVVVLYFDIQIEEVDLVSFFCFTPIMYFLITRGSTVRVLTKRAGSVDKLIQILLFSDDEDKAKKVRTLLVSKKIILSQKALKRDLKIARDLNEQEKGSE